MSIDNCPYTSTELINKVFPRYISNILKNKKDRLQMSVFAKPGIGVKSILKEHARTNDFSGCYVLFEKGKPIYVGISRNVYRRLIQHVRGKTHFDASLAYRIACRKNPHKLTRTKAMDLDSFSIYFEQAKKYLQTLSVVIVEIENPLELYFFEPYCAMALDTFEWNTFQTH